MEPETDGIKHTNNDSTKNTTAHAPRKRLKTCSDNDTYQDTKFLQTIRDARRSRQLQQLIDQSKSNDRFEATQQPAKEQRHRRNSQQSAVSSQQVSSQQSAVSGQQSAVSSQQSAVNKSAFSSQQSAVSSEQAANSDSIKHKTQAHGRHREPEDTGAKREGRSTDSTCTGNTVTRIMAAPCTTQSQETTTERTKHVDLTPLPYVALRAAPQVIPGNDNGNRPAPAMRRIQDATQQLAHGSSNVTTAIVTADPTEPISFSNQRHLRQ
jgi:hypothetical protein